MQEEAHIHRARSWVAGIATLVVLLLLGIFVARVWYYAGALRSGTLDASAFNFIGSQTLSATLAAQPVKDGTFDVATTDDPRLGRADAPVTIVEFADFGCPYSRESSFVVRELAAKYPEFVRFIYRDFPIVELHPIAQKAAEAAQCAQDQGTFWEYHDKLYQNQNDLSEDRLVEFATELNMNTFQFESCLSSGRYADEVIEDYQAGVAAGVRGTPTFFINGNRIAGAIPKEILEALIQSVASNR